MEIKFAPRIAEMTADNILKDGGSSIKIADLSSPTDGYMVSFKNPTLIMESPTRESLIGNTAAFLMSNSAFAESLDDLYLGGWRDNEDGKVYIDFSVNIAELASALEFARDNDQLAIFDVKGGKEIRL